MSFLYVTSFIPHQKYVGALGTPQVQVPQICPGPPFFRGSALDFLQQGFPSNPMDTSTRKDTLSRPYSRSSGQWCSPYKCPLDTSQESAGLPPKGRSQPKKMTPEGRQPRAPCCEKTGCLLSYCFVIFNVLLPPHSSRGLQRHILLSVRKEKKKIKKSIFPLQGHLKCSPYIP